MALGADVGPHGAGGEIDGPQERGDARSGDADAVCDGLLGQIGEGKTQSADCERFGRDISHIYGSCYLAAGHLSIAGKCANMAP